MNPLLEQFHDIEGLDSISVWPLAIGWWIGISMMFLIIFLGICYAIYWITYKRSWKSDTIQKISNLERNLSDATARQTLIYLSEYLRRIALRRFSRKECAALTGKAWLKWLKEHDPKGFDWEKEGILLIDIPYAPEKTYLSANQVKDLIPAIKNWVC